MGKILYAEKDGINVLKFIGDVRVTLGPTINTFLDRLCENPGFKSVVFDLSETEAIDSTSLGLLAKISLRTQESFDVVPTIVSPREDITRILISMGFDEVFVILKELVNECGQPCELPAEIVSESRLREQVIDAHRVLMSLNQSNQDEFCDLVEALEEESNAEPEAPQKKMVRNRVA